MTSGAIDAAVAAFRAGRGVLVVDDETRENEGGVVFAAVSITEADLAFLMSECRGLVCVAMTGEALDRLRIPLMVAETRIPIARLSPCPSMRAQASRRASPQQTVR